MSGTQVTQEQEQSEKSLISGLPQEIRAYVMEAPVSIRNILARAYSRDGSRATAIKAKCLDCSNFQRQEITECTVTSCPLWRYRPYI